MSEQPYTPSTVEVRNAYRLSDQDIDGSPYLPEKSDTEFERWLAGVKAEALERAARDLRATECGPYESESGMCSDDWGNDSKAIDTWYAAQLEELAANYRRGAQR